MRYADITKVSEDERQNQTTITKKEQQTDNKQKINENLP